MANASLTGLSTLSTRHPIATRRIFSNTVWVGIHHLTLKQGLGCRWVVWEVSTRSTIKSRPAVCETWVRSWVEKISWRRKWQPTPIFLPGESHGQGSLAGSMRCGPPGSSVHGILQARILDWVAMPFSRGSSQPRDQTQLSRIARRCFNIWATREGHQLVSSLISTYCWNTKWSSVSAKSHQFCLKYYLDIIYSWVYSFLVSF